jgi:hydrogenase nickel incorporation protein HypB
METRTLAARQGILLKNDEQAGPNRERFRSLGLLTLNVLSSAGSGKTALLESGNRHEEGAHPHFW